MSGGCFFSFDSHFKWDKKKKKIDKKFVVNNGIWRFSPPNQTPFFVIEKLKKENR